VNLLWIFPKIVCERQDHPVRRDAHVAELAEGIGGGEELVGGLDAECLDDAADADGGGGMGAPKSSELPARPALTADGDEGFVIVAGEGGADDLLIGAWVECSIHIRSFHFASLRAFVL
jgi:hypothetical protein